MFSKYFTLLAAALYLAASLGANTAIAAEFVTFFGAVAAVVEQEREGDHG